MDKNTNIDFYMDHLGKKQSLNTDLFFIKTN